jgi:hypothetical protein
MEHAWVHPEKTRTAHEVLELLTSKRILPGASSDDAYRLDVWGNPYHWRIQKDADSFTILIGSCGPNGRWEGKRNDDIWVEIRQLDGQVRMSSNIKPGGEKTPGRRY